MTKNTICYETSSGHRRYWNTNWFLKVEMRKDEGTGNPIVEITTAIPPGPATQVGGMMMAKPFITITLFNGEAQRFTREFEKLASYPRRRRTPMKPPSNDGNASATVPQESANADRYTQE